MGNTLLISILSLVSVQRWASRGQRHRLTALKEPAGEAGGQMQGDSVSRRVVGTIMVGFVCGTGRELRKLPGAC